MDYSTRLKYHRTSLRDDFDMSRCISKENQKFADFLSAHRIRTSYEYKIGNKSYDILLEGKNILIEIDPSYTHNSTNKVLLKGQGRGSQKSRAYHYMKTKTAMQNGFICLHKFDWVSDMDILRIIRQIHRYQFIQEEKPRLHWYHILRQHHIEDFDEKLNKVSMRESGYVEIYDDGVIYDKI